VNKLGSSERFGYEWQLYSEIVPEYEEQFRRWTAHLQPKDWRGKVILDAGCGIGRNSYWPMHYGAASGVAIDIDDRTLAVARRNLAAFPQMRVESVSIYDLPYKHTFDIAFSIGVIHHLEFPQRALEAMVRSVKPGGQVLIWVYGRENNHWVILFLDPIRKLLLSRLPISVVSALSVFPTTLLWLALHLGLGRIEYLRFARRFRFRQLRAIVFDQMLPRISHYWPKEIVQQMMEQAGLEDVNLLWVNQMSWSAIGTRPAR
jgi:SAM-dependent methyltransferase